MNLLILAILLFYGYNYKLLPHQNKRYITCTNSVLKKNGKIKFEYVKNNVIDINSIKKLK